MDAGLVSQSHALTPINASEYQPQDGRVTTVATLQLVACTGCAPRHRHGARTPLLQTAKQTVPDVGAVRQSGAGAADGAPDPINNGAAHDRALRSRLCEQSRGGRVCDRSRLNIVAGEREVSGSVFATAMFASLQGVCPTRRSGLARIGGMT